MSNSYATSNLSIVLNPVYWPCLASLVLALGSLQVFYVQGHTEPRYLNWVCLWTPWERWVGMESTVLLGMNGDELHTPQAGRREVCDLVVWLMRTVTAWGRRSRDVDLWVIESSVIMIAIILLTFTRGCPMEAIIQSSAAPCYNIHFAKEEIEAQRS